MGQGASGADPASRTQAGGARAPARRPYVLTPERFRIVAFGSSSTEGSGAPTPDRSYPAQLAKAFGERQPELPVEVLDRGVGGDDILAMLARLERDVLAERPDLVIWQVGSNDPLHGISLDTFRAALATGAAAIAAAGSELMLMEPQWSPALDGADQDHAFVDAVREFGDARRLFVLRRFELMQAWAATGRASPGQMIGPDGLHMTDLGYALLAESVFEAVTRHSGAFAVFAGRAAASAAGVSRGGRAFPPRTPAST